MYEEDTVLNNDAATMERKGREGRREILFFFASFAASAFDRDLSQSTTASINHAPLPRS
jgi:hypothetical protein